jgi:predicted metal-dependent enzyme (double-stranded beta helix superfamily)
MAMATTAAVPGLDRLIEVIDGAVAHRSFEGITGSLKEGLQKLIREGHIDLPGELCTACRDHYGRRLLYRSPDHGYAVVAMIWGPGQGTALHDHAGTWCVEGVVQGEIEVTQYDLLEHQGEQWRFHQEETLVTGVGAAGSLIPPFEYHTIRNARGDATSVTVHIYGEEMEQCTIFEPEGAEGWYRRRSKALSYDN